MFRLGFLYGDQCGTRAINRAFKAEKKEKETSS
jgi:hypothetical protein